MQETISSAQFSTGQTTYYTEKQPTILVTVLESNWSIGKSKVYPNRKSHSHMQVRLWENKFFYNPTEKSMFTATAEIPHSPRCNVFSSSLIKLIECVFLFNRSRKKKRKTIYLSLLPCAFLYDHLFNQELSKSQASKMFY